VVPRCPGRGVTAKTGKREELLSSEAAAAARNAAVGGACALLLSLVGAVIGGWMTSGEPMTLTYYRMRGRDRAPSTF
jgi:hypothetical protein